MKVNNPTDLVEENLLYKIFTKHFNSIPIKDRTFDSMDKVRFKTKKEFQDTHRKDADIVWNRCYEKASIRNKQL